MNSQPIGSHFCQQTDMFLHFTCSLERRNNQSQNSSFWNDIKPRFSCMVQLGSILVPGTFLNLVFRSRQCRRDSDTAVISSWSDTATGIPSKGWLVFLILGMWPFVTATRQTFGKGQSLVWSWVLGVQIKCLVLWLKTMHFHTIWQFLLQCL